MSTLPIDRRKLQSPTFHFFAKLFGILLHAFTSKAIPPASLHIHMNLTPHVFIKRQQTFIFRL